uniref:Uncharacterized protein n=1 Tax=Laticauda laticaudata TaxID=8630 RepID=A0A8C5SKF1_LATLA
LLLFKLTFVPSCAHWEQAPTTFLSLPLGSSRSVMTLPPALAGAGPRRGSMPLPIKHQLVRASAVDELDSPPSSPEVSSHGGASPAGGRGPYKVMLLGESGVGKTTLAAIFGGMKGVSHPEEDHEGKDDQKKEWPFLSRNPLNFTLCFASWERTSFFSPSHKCE